MAEEPDDDREGRDPSADPDADTAESADDAVDEGDDPAVDDGSESADDPEADGHGTDQFEDDADVTPAVRRVDDAPDDPSGDDGVEVHYPDPGGELEVPEADEPDHPGIHDRYDGPASNVSDEEAAEMRAMQGESAAPGASGEAPTGEPADAEASDGGYADERDPYAEYDDYELEETTVHEGAPDDREMPLADHIEEMVKRLGAVVVVMAVVSGIVFPFGADLINFLWYSYLPGTVTQCPEAAATAADLGPGDAACPRVYHPLAVILARLKIATLVGFLVALPVFVYETYLFMRPGLYPTERRYYLASVPTSLLLAAAGVAFAHFLVIPAIFTYFVYYSDSATTIAFGLTETFDLMVLLMGGFAIVFQIPLFIMLALMMGLVTRRWIADRRLIFWGVYAGLAFLFSPDPTGMAPIIVAATMIALHEGTLLLAKWTGRG